MASATPRETPPSQLLQDVNILITSLVESEREKLRAMAKAHGAKLLSTARKDFPPHVIITRCVGSPRYFAVLRHHPLVPVVTPEWLTTCVETGQRVPFTAYTAGAFLGLIVCFSGLPVAEKNMYASDVSRLGGIHSPALSKDCTHLVTVSTDSDKFRFAQRNNITCVTPDWLMDSVATGRCLEADKYLMKTRTAGHTAAVAAAAAAALNAAAARAEDDRLTSVTTRSGSVEPTRLPEASLRSAGGGRGSSRLGHQAPSAGGAAGGYELPAGEGIVPEPEAYDPDDEDDAEGGGTGAQHATAFNPGASWATLECDDAAPLSMESCYLWVVGCSPEEAREVTALCCQGGAKRFSEPHPTLLTHVVAGRSVDARQADEVTRFLSAHRDVELVTLEWLRRSVARKEVLPADERFTVHLPALLGRSMAMPPLGQALLAGGGLTREGSFSGHAGEGSNTGGGSLTRQPSGGGASLLGPPANTNSGSSFLRGYFFTLAALKNRGERDTAELVIRNHGGRTFASSAPLVEHRGIFALCPHSLTPAKARALQSAHPDFAAVREGDRYTLYWLECCAQAGDVLRPQYGTPCFQPLPYDLPLPGMERASVVVSGIDRSARAAIQRTVEIVGGRFSETCMSAKDTHLIVPVAKGEKYRHCARFGVIPVTPDWLVDSVVRGRLQPESNYAPLLPRGCPPPEPIGSSDVVTSSGRLPSQVATQLPGAPPGVTSLYQAAMAGPRSAAGGSSGAATAPARQPAGTAAPPEPDPHQPSVAPTSALRERARKFSAAVVGGKTSAASGTAGKAAAAAGKEALKKQKQHPAAGASGTGKAAPLALQAGAAAKAPEPDTEPDLVPPPNGDLIADEEAELMPEAGAAAGTEEGSRAVAEGANGGNSQQQLQLNGIEDGADLDAAMVEMSSLLDRVRGREGVGRGGAAVVHGSQLDMPPPPPRGDAAAGPGRVGRGKRGRGAGGDSGYDEVALRRPLRHRAAAPESEPDLLAGDTLMSQQVGYDSSDVAELVVLPPTAGGHRAAAQNAAKELLARAATRQSRRLAGNKEDILEEFS